ncbi:polysaccharide pyruvyl transferase family protein [Patescibacteria group bacterium]|nr:polysaccharide pyruvyl transferase family protein [Patescibacteria group bacterium]
MKILHLANWNSTNIGNGALIYGTERLLTEDAPYPIEIVPEAWDDYTFQLKHFDEAFVARVNAHDALLVNGAVTFNAFREKMTETGMRLNLPFRLWDQIQRPIIFYGLSYRCWPFQSYPNTDALTRFVRWAIERPNIFFGVRNDGTKEWIEQRLGIISDQIYEVPDPGMFVPHEDRVYPELHPGKKNVLISLNNEDAVYRFATPFQKKCWSLLAPHVSDLHLRRTFQSIGLYRSLRLSISQSLARVVEELSRDEDIHFVLVPHYLDDYFMLDELVGELVERIAHQRLTSTGLLRVPETGYFYGRYAKADLALSMRVHSMSPSIGLGTPVVPITSQGRMTNYLAKIGLSDIAVDMRSPSFAQELVKKSTSLLHDPRPFKDRVSVVNRDLRECAKENNKRIFELLSQ